MLVTLLASALAMPLLAQTADIRPQGTPTRGIVVFSALEKDLGTAVASGNRQGIDKLLADDFEQRDAASPGTPLPRAEWLASHPDQATVAPPLSDMSVHDYGTLAVVSFVAPPPPATPAAGSSFIVDVWRNVEGSWQLQVRYRSASTASAPTEDQRPTGKQ
jgi:hypothetical protein